VNSRLFRINGLGGNCPHVIDSINTYTYPFLGVGLSGGQLLASSVSKYHFGTCQRRVEPRGLAAGEPEILNFLGPLNRCTRRWADEPEKFNGEGTKVTERFRIGKECRQAASYVAETAVGQQASRRRPIRSPVRGSACARSSRPPRQLPITGIPAAPRRAAPDHPTEYAVALALRW
jgi:hypothetical protein